MGHEHLGIEVYVSFPRDLKVVISLGRFHKLKFSVLLTFIRCVSMQIEGYKQIQPPKTFDPVQVLMDSWVVHSYLLKIYHYLSN